MGRKLTDKQIRVLRAVSDGIPRTGMEIMPLAEFYQTTGLASVLTSLYKRGLMGCVSMAPIQWAITDAGKAALAPQNIHEREGK